MSSNFATSWQKHIPKEFETNVYVYSGLCQCNKHNPLDYVVIQLFHDPWTTDVHGLPSVTSKVERCWRNVTNVHASVISWYLLEALGLVVIFAQAIVYICIELRVLAFMWHLRVCAKNTVVTTILSFLFTTGLECDQCLERCGCHKFTLLKHDNWSRFNGVRLWAVITLQTL